MVDTKRALAASLLIATACAEAGPGAQDRAASTDTFHLRGRVERPQAAAADDTFVGVLWRPFCNGCSIERDDGAEVAPLWDLASRVWLQEVQVVGAFPSDFTLVLDDAPPPELAAADYATGVVVVARRGGPTTLDRDERFVNTGFTMPYLFADEADALGVIAMTSLYIGWSAPGVRVHDVNVPVDERAWLHEVRASEPPLPAGYVVAEHDAAALVATPAHHLCSRDVPAGPDASCLEPHEDDVVTALDVACPSPEVDAACGPRADPYEGIVRLETGDTFSIDVGGPDDLLRALDGLSPDDF